MGEENKLQPEDMNKPLKDLSKEQLIELVHHQQEQMQRVGKAYEALRGQAIEAAEAVNTVEFMFRILDHKDCFEPLFVTEIAGAIKDMLEKKPAAVEAKNGQE